ncbi:hypothetical protein L6R53_29580 [Myxococcota bacterium]|nr:hypothetical protein [Myxococcota bacterium]
MRPSPPRPWPRVAAGLVLAELLATGLDLWLGPFARVHWEERFNARVGVQLLCGHAEKALDLQYRTFCGGCTAEAWLAVPLFATLGPTHLVWKLVPALFHAAILALGAGVAARAAGAPAAAAWALLMLGAPGYYRELAHTGWGNHAESTALPLLALVLLLGAERAPAPARALRGALAGAATGLGLWFAHTSAHLLPAALLVALLSLRGQVLAFLVALPIGLWPWWAYHRDRDPARDHAGDWLTAVDLAPPGALWDWLFGPDLRQGLWDAADYGPMAAGPTSWWALAWALAAVGLVVALRRAARADGPHRAALLVGPLGLLALIAAYALRHDLWSNLPDPYVNAAFNLRYRAPLWPMLALCAAPLVTLPGPAARRLAWLGIGLVAAWGLAWRASLWTGGRDAWRGLHVFAHDGWADAIVPLGQPPEQIRRLQGRPQDLQAALAWLQAHRDPLPACRSAHVFELGRRIGVAVGQDPARQDLAPALAGALALPDPHPLDPRFLAFGIAKALDPKGELRRPDLSRLLDGLAAASPPGLALDLDVGRELGQLGWEQAWVKDEESRPDWLDPRAWEGVCAGRGARDVALATGEGAHRPAEVHGEDWVRGQCPSRDSYWRGLGAAWARLVGCRDGDARDLAARAGDRAAAAWQGYEPACVEHRGHAAPTLVSSGPPR